MYDNRSSSTEDDKLNDETMQAALCVYVHQNHKRICKQRFKFKGGEIV